MPLLIFRQPLFSIARMLWRPVLAPWLGLAVTSAPVYNILWTFAAYTINTVGLFRGIRILLNLRRYLLGYLTISNLTNIIVTTSPILGFIFTNILKDPLIGIARMGILSRKGFISLISFIIFNSFFLLSRTLIYIGLKCIIYIIISIFSIFWFDGLSKFKGLLSLAFDIKEWFEDHLFPNGISLPVPKNRLKPEPFYKLILESLYKISGSYPEKMISIFKPKEEIVTRRIGNIEELFKENKLNEVISEPANDVIVNNYISMLEFSSNIIFDFLARLLLHSFVEFNLFI